MIRFKHPFSMFRCENESQSIIKCSPDVLKRKKQKFQKFNMKKKYFMRINIEAREIGIKILFLQINGSSSLIYTYRLQMHLIQSLPSYIKIYRFYCNLMNSILISSVKSKNRTFMYTYHITLKFKLFPFYSYALKQLSCYIYVIRQNILTSFKPVIKGAYWIIQ